MQRESTINLNDSRGEAQMKPKTKCPRQSGSSRQA